MERRKSQTLTDALFLFMRASGMETPLLQHRVVENWTKTVKPEIAQRTRALRVQNQQLFVEADSPSLCSYLAMYRSQLVMRLNERVGSRIIRDIRFFPKT